MKKDCTLNPKKVSCDDAALSNKGDDVVKIIIGINDFETWCYKNSRKDLLEQWCYDKNTKTPNQYTKGSNQKVWWKCSRGHFYEMKIYDRTTKKENCPFCGSQRLLKGYNDLATTSPELIEEWDFEKNYPLTPYDVMDKTNKKVWWKCKNGHSYQSRLDHRTDGHGCPYCAGSKSIVGVNDLKTLYPDLCKQWDYEKNKNGPEQFLPSSNKKAWWKCEQGHSWSAIISSRTINRRGCPYCWRERKTSFNEQTIFYYVRKLFPDAINGSKNVIGMELDIFIPSIMTAIEYDGVFWHVDKKEVDITKNKLCAEKGIRLIRLRENGLPDISDTTRDSCCICIPVFTKNHYSYQSFKSDTEPLTKAVNKLILIFNKNVSDDFVNIRRDYIEIMSGYIESKKSNNLLKQYPLIAKEWNNEKNGMLSPEMFRPHSNKKVWWKCALGHEWEAMISHRVRGRNCPFCSNRKALQGYNTLDVTNPFLVKEWNFTKNKLSPNKVLRGSYKKVFWICLKCGFEWQATISSRACTGRGCPKCGQEKTRKAQIKAVINIDTGNIYESAKDASVNTGIGQSSIRNACNGLSKTAGGYHWKYYINDEQLQPKLLS